METITSPFDEISKDLNSQIELCEDALNETSREMSLIKNDAKTYNQAWTNFAFVSAMMHQFLTLRNLILNNDEKTAENFIRFTVYQIQQFNDAESILASEQAASDNVPCGMIAVYEVFKSYINKLDAE